MSRVSVVIPTCQRPIPLRRAIESVLAQTFQDFELIVIDDASGDSTGQVVESMTDARIRYICHETNKGGSAARNTGIRNARGAYIAFLDDDDEWLPEKLAAQCAVLDNSPAKIGIVYTGYTRIDRTSGKVLSLRIPKKKGDLHDALQLENCLGSTSSVLVKKECFETVGLFDESLPSFQDYDMWLRISKHFHITYVNEILLKYYVHEIKISTSPEKFGKGLERMMAKLGSDSSVLRKNFSIQYCKLGLLYGFKGNSGEGRRAYATAIKLCPLSIKPFAGFFLSLFGAKVFQMVVEASVRKTNSLNVLCV
ncbi:MAG: glycosyl transferase [Nitrospirales bacterium]|nr:MAG: glycosyl transferase [Nitrospirales bacterium]